MKKKWIWLGLPALLLVFISGFLIWASFPLGPTAAALSALESDSEVEVFSMPDMVVFIPSQIEPENRVDLLSGRQGRLPFLRSTFEKCGGSRVSGSVTEDAA